LLNTLELRLCRGRHREEIMFVGSVEPFEEGIERVQGVHRRISISISLKEDHMKFYEALPRGH
jgi:hypothetical protein